MTTPSSAPPEWDLLLSAAQKNDAPRIHTMVTEGGVNPRHANGVGQTALHIAALWGNVEAVQALVDAGANNRAQNNLTGATPLHMVAQSTKGSLERRLQVVDILLAAGADPSQSDKFGALPVDVLRLEEMDAISQKLAEKFLPQAPALIQAIEKADLNAVQDCLPDQVGISFRDQTPVMHAVKQLLVAVDDEEIPKAESLVAILNALSNSGGDRSAGIAIESEDSPVFLLLTQLQIDLMAGSETASLLKQAIAILSNSTIPKDGWQLLQRAARRGDLPFLKYLVEELNMNPNTKGRQGMTALQFAARSGRLSVLNYLLELPNIDVHIKDDRNQTPLDAARVNQKQDVVAILQEYIQTHP